MLLIRTSLAVACLMASAAFAQTASVKVEGAWARATVQGQKGTGAFMKLTAPRAPNWWVRRRPPQA